MISITWAVGAMLGAQAPALQGMFQSSGMDTLKSFQTTMVIFGVVASGSMAARDRMSAVGGATLSLLRDAYQRRDKVAVITFR